MKTSVLKKIKPIFTRSYALAFLTAILIVLSLPKFEFDFLIWFAFLPALYAINDKTPKESFKIGWFCGFFQNLFDFYWITDTISNYSNLPLSLSILALLLFSIYSGLFLGLLFFLYRKSYTNSFTFGFLFFPAFYVVLEFIFPLIFPWMLATCFYNRPILIQIADITGVYGITFWIALINILLFEVLTNKNQRLLKVSVGLSVSALIIGYGFWSMNYREYDTSKSINFSAIQSNILIDERMESDAPTSIIDRLYNMTLNDQTKSELIIWSEAVFPYYFREGSPSGEILKEIAKIKNAIFIFGALTINKTDIFNSIVTFDKNGELVKIYNKMKLLIFGEYLPFEEYFPVLKEWIQGGGHFKAGEEYAVIPVKEGIKVSTPICYEMIVPTFVRKFIEKGSNLLINITNDVWFGNTFSPYQHFALCLFRSVENRVPFIRCANTGITSLVSLKGEILYSSEIYKAEVVSGKVFTGNNYSFYSTFGDLFAWLNFICCGIFMSLFYFRTSKKRENNGKNQKN